MGEDVDELVEDDEKLNHSPFPCTKFNNRKDTTR